MSFTSSFVADVIIAIELYNEPVCHKVHCCFVTVLITNECWWFCPWYPCLPQRCCSYCIYHVSSCDQLAVVVAKSKSAKSTMPGLTTRHYLLSTLVTINLTSLVFC